MFLFGIVLFIFDVIWFSIPSYKPTLLLLSATLLLVRNLNNNCWGEFVWALFPSSRKSLCFSQWSWHLLSVPDTFYLTKEQKPWNNIKLILPWTENKEVFCFMSSVSGTRSNSGDHDTGGSEEKIHRVFQTGVEPMMFW